VDLHGLSDPRLISHISTSPARILNTTRKDSLFGKKARLLATVLLKESRTGSPRELTRSVKALTMSAFGSEDETVHYRFS
jgi:hypothetical protein